MKLAHPAALLLLAALVPAALLLFPGLRRRERPVAAFPLLRELVGGLPRLPRGYLLRRRLQALCLLLAMAAAALAAAGPVLGRADDPAREMVLLLDHAGAGGDDDGAASWARTVETAARLARPWRRDDRVTLLRSDGGIVGGGPLPPAEAARRVRREPRSALPLDPPASLDLLAVAAAARRPAFAGIVTPRPGIWAPLAAGRGAAWHVIPTGAPAGGANHALLEVEVRADLLRAGRVALFARAGAFGPPAPDPAELTLAVSVDGRPLATRSFRLGPGETRGEVFPQLDAGGGVLRLELGPKDAFSDDDVYLTPLPGRGSVPLLLVTEENAPLAAALRALPGVAPAPARPRDPEPPGSAAATVRVYDRTAPPDATGNILAIAPPEGLPGVGYRGEAAAPAPVVADRTHFLLEGVGLEGLRLERLPIYELPEGMAVLATAGGHPLIAAGRGPGGGRLALVAFDPVESGWFRTPSFPILVANLVAWLAEGPVGTRASLLVGETLPASAARGLRSLRDPAGREVPRPAGGWEAFAPAVPGRWVARLDGAEGDLFVNLLDPELSAAVAAVPAPAPHQPAAPDPPARPFRAEIASPLLVAAALLLLLERLVAPPRRAGRLS